MAVGLPPASCHHGSADRTRLGGWTARHRAGPSWPRPDGPGDARGALRRAPTARGLRVVERGRGSPALPAGRPSRSPRRVLSDRPQGDGFGRPSFICPADPAAVGARDTLPGVCPAPPPTGFTALSTAAF